MADPRKSLVLVVDDESIVRQTVTGILSGTEFSVAVAVDGVEALAVYKLRKQEIALVLTDVLMPFMNGIQLAAEILKINPSTKILLMSGYSDEVLTRQGLQQGLPLLHKPFLRGDLLSKIRSVLAAAAASD